MDSRGDGTAAGGGGAYRLTLAPVLGASTADPVAVSSIRMTLDVALTAVATLALPRPVFSRSYSSSDLIALADNEFEQALGAVALDGVDVDGDRALRGAGVEATAR